MDGQGTGRLEASGVVGAQESKQAGEAELGRAFCGTGDSGASETRSTGGAAVEDNMECCSGVVFEEELCSTTPAVARAVNDEDAAAEEKEEEEVEEEHEHDIEGGTVWDYGSIPAAKGAGNGSDDGAEEKEEDGGGRNQSEGGVVGHGQAGEKKTNRVSSAVAVGGMAEDVKGSAVQSEAGENDADNGSAVQAGGEVEETKGEVL